MTSIYKSICFFILMLTVWMIPATGWPESIVWHPYDEGITIGKEKEKKSIVHFYANWCGYCLKMNRETFKNPEVINYMNKHFVSIRVNIDRQKKLASRYGVRSVPTTWFLTETGKKIDGVPGFIKPWNFVAILKKAKSIPSD